MKRSLSMIFIIFALTVTPTQAVYNANLSGVITHILTYADGDAILVRLSTQPTSHPVCNPSYFVIESSTDPKRMNRMYARLLTARTTGETINIGYDSQGACANGYIRIHRVG